MTREAPFAPREEEPVAEGTLMESLIAAFAVVLVVGAIGALLFRIVRGDAEARKLEQLKQDLEAKQRGASAPP